MKKREFIVQDLLSKIYQEEFIEGKLPEIMAFPALRFNKQSKI